MDKIIELTARRKRVCEKSVEALVRQKLSSYARQDERALRPCEDNISEEETMRLLDACGMKCAYCQCEMSASGPRQWTLDRIENHIAHTVGNVVASCLKCNTLNRRQDTRRFREGAEIARRVACGEPAVVRI